MFSSPGVFSSCTVTSQSSQSLLVESFCLVEPSAHTCRHPCVCRMCSNSCCSSPLILSQRWVTTLPSPPATVSRRTSPSGKVGPPLISETLPCCFVDTCLNPLTNFLCQTMKVMIGSTAYVLHFWFSFFIFKMWDGKTSSGGNRWRFYRWDL